VPYAGGSSLVATASFADLEDAPLDAPAAVSAGPSRDPLLGMSTLAADAYVRAAEWTADAHPSCGVDAAFLAGIGEIDGGAARTPMHLTPAAWAQHAADGDGDGVRSPNAIHDAARATAGRLCAIAADLRAETAGTLSSPAAQHRLAFAYAADDARAPYVVSPNDTIVADEFATDVVRMAADVRTALGEFAAVAHDADPRVARVVTWLREQVMIGAKYAATNPGRFGTPWDGRAKRSFHSGRVYQYPAGTITYDCSGLVVVAFRQIGVDLFARDAAWTGGMLANLPKMPRADASVGDLLILGSGGRTTHVVVYLGGDRYVHAGACGGEMAVCERVGIDWGRVIGVVRVLLG
jgi:hypothetical protein